MTNKPALFIIQIDYHHHHHHKSMPRKKFPDTNFRKELTYHSDFSRHQQHKAGRFSVASHFGVTADGAVAI
jgi:hypothetical protein